MIDLRPLHPGIGQGGMSGVEYQLLQPLIPDPRGGSMHRLPDHKHIH